MTAPHTHLIVSPSWLAACGREHVQGIALEIISARAFDGRGTFYTVDMPNWGSWEVWDLRGVTLITMGEDHAAHVITYTAKPPVPLATEEAVIVEELAATARCFTPRAFPPVITADVPGTLEWSVAELLAYHLAALDQAKARGVAAYDSPLNANPYIRGSSCHSAWVAGHSAENARQWAAKPRKGGIRWIAALAAVLAPTHGRTA